MTESDNKPAPKNILANPSGEPQLPLAEKLIVASAFLRQGKAKLNASPEFTEGVKSAFLSSDLIIQQDRKNGKVTFHRSGWTWEVTHKANAEGEELSFIKYPLIEDVSPELVSEEFKVAVSQNPDNTGFMYNQIWTAESKRPSVFEKNSTSAKQNGMVFIGNF